MPNWNALNNRTRRAAVIEELVGTDPSPDQKLALEVAEAVQEAARFLRQMRERAGLSQEELGKRLNVTQARISELERGGTPEGMSYAILRRAAKACGLQDWPTAPGAKSRRSVDAAPFIVKVTKSLEHGRLKNELTKKMRFENRYES